MTKIVISPGFLKYSFSYDYLKTIIEYNPETGELFRLVKGLKKSLKLTFLSSIHIHNHNYKLKDILFFYINKFWPTSHIHIHNNSNLKFKNLEEYYKFPNYNNTIPLTVLKTIFRYNSQTGLAYWKRTIGKSSIKDDLITNEIVSINMKTYKLNDLIWFYMTGKWPNRLILVDSNMSNRKINNIKDIYKIDKKFETKQISFELLIELLNYNPNTGIFTWLKTLGSIAIENSIAGNITNDGYVYITIKKKNYYAHRLAWFYMTGNWPNIIDHDDQDKANNKWNNLNNGTQSDNRKNCKNSKEIGIYGVRCIKSNNDIKWISEITINYKSIRLGTFYDKFEAICSRKSAENKYNFHKNHGQFDRETL